MARITFDLSACAVQDGEQRRRKQEIAMQALNELRTRPLIAQAPPATQRLPSSKQLSIRFVTNPEPPPPPTPQECFVDQYAVGDPNDDKECCARFVELLHGTMVSNVVIINKGQKTSDLLGKTGHYERFSVWSHVFGAISFVIYALVRPSWVKDPEAIASVLASVASWMTAAVFAASFLYHATAPDAERTCSVPM